MTSARIGLTTRQNQQLALLAITATLVAIIARGLHPAHAVPAAGELLWAGVFVLVLLSPGRPGGDSA